MNNSSKKMRKEIIASKKPLNELLSSVRLGIIDYDLDTVKELKDGDNETVIEIKSKMDGKIYLGKRLKIKSNSIDNEIN
jgi:hypothetical protein